MKRMYIMVSILILLSTACVSTGKVTQAQVSSMTNPQNTPQHRVWVVMADEALHLRTAPEELGGTVIAVMPYGSEFIVRSCMMVGGTQWAFGDYIHGGDRTQGWAASRYISGGCDD